MKYFIVIALLFISGCDIVVDALFDCIDGDGPEFDPHSLPTAVLNEEYYAKITASIRNEPGDSLYDYDFDWEGDLPAGLTLRTPADDRVAIIEGTPTEYGDFHFTLKVKVRLQDYAWSRINEQDYDGNLCYDREVEDYTLHVEIMSQN